MFGGLDLVLVEGRPPAEVHRQVQQAVHPVDQQDQAGDDEAGQGEGAMGGGQV